MAATIAACADEVSDLPDGRVVSTPSLPLVWSVNCVEVHRGVARPEAVEPHLPPVPRPAVLARERAEGFDGWQVERELVMPLEHPPEPPPPGAVRPARREEVEPLQARWLEHDFGHQGPDAVRQLIAYVRRQWDARETRAFTNPDATAMTLLWAEGGIAQVEDVYTAPEARGRGHARALVSHVAALAHAEGNDVFIIADADDTPQQLYERLGFRRERLLERFIRRAQS